VNFSMIRMGVSLGVSSGCIFDYCLKFIFGSSSIQVAETEKAKAYSPKKDAALIMNCEGLH